MNMIPLIFFDRLKSAVLLLALLLVLSLGAGCAAKQVDTPAPAPKAQEAAVTPRQQDSTEKTAPAPAQQSAPTGQQAASEAKQKISADTGKSTVARMLEKAGRNPEGEQPEADFFLSAPNRIGDGEAFSVAFAAQGAQKLDIRWRGKNISLIQTNPVTGRFEAMLPVALDEQAKSLPLALTVVWADGRSELFSTDLPLVRRKYPLQKLRVAPKYARHPPEMDEKVKRDRAEIRAAVTKISPLQYWSLPFLRPVPGEVTSLFGARREFNGKKSNPHRGVDFDAQEGDPILALEGGVVVLVSDHYYSGNITVIDHGLGVMSAYLHQSAFAVSVGQQVKRGEVIGYIGSTGRSTGPHLHLSLYVLGESVNAAPCIIGMER